MNNDPLNTKQNTSEENAHGFDVLKKHLPLNRPQPQSVSADDQSRIEDLKKKLYSKSMSGVDHIRRPGLHEHSSLQDENWASEKDKALPKFEGYQGNSKRRLFLKRLLTFSLFIFLVAMAYGAYQIMSGNNFVSGSNIDIKVTGPITISSGDTLVLDLDITNQNSGAIELADLVMTYPEGTRQTSDNTIPIITDRISIGTIQPGETVKKRIEVVLFSETGSSKTINVSLEYRVPGSTSIFRKQKDAALAIGNSPITLAVDSVSEVTSGQEITMTLDLKSNSSQLLKGILLKAEYPFGFKFKSATPVPVSGIDTWDLGDIPANSEQKIKIVGIMTSDEDTERVFKFNIGTIDPNDETKIATNFIATERPLAVKKPFIATNITLDSKNTKTVSIPAGEIVQSEITWQNNLDVPINNVVIEAKLSGDFLDRNSIKSSPGFFRSKDNTIVWDKSNLKDLEEVKAGGTGRVVFSFASIAASKDNVGTVKSPAINVDLTIHATRLNENDVQDNIQSVVSKSVQVKTELALKTNLMKNLGPFSNTGPFPTIAEKVTTFTANVKVSNSFNTVKNAVYTTTLPNYVDWTGQVSPQTSQVSYDPLSRIVTWNVGDVVSGTGYSSPAKEMYYQIAFKPGLSQVGATPIVTKEQSVAGIDSFTGDPIEGSDVPLDIKIDSDPQYEFGQDHVLEK